MASTYDIVVAGGGHNGLIAACYLAKAGLKVCVVEKNDTVGGGARTSELTVPGFKHDSCSLAHILLQANPLIRNDELKLQSQFGLRYVQPEMMTACLFDDGDVIEFHKDIDKTCAGIAKFSEHDAEAYRRFDAKVGAILELVLMGLYSTPPTFGMQAAMLDQSPEGRFLMRTQAMSAWDVVDEWFESDKLKIALSRYAAESCLSPFMPGSGILVFLKMPYLHRFGLGIAIGGSGALSDTLATFLQQHGGEIRTGSGVSEFTSSGNTITGLKLENGEEITASRAVISNLNVKQVFPHMVPGVTLPDGFAQSIEVLKHSSLQPFTMHLALNEAPAYKASADLNGFSWIQRCRSTPEAYARCWNETELGYPQRDLVSYSQSTTVDPSRAPPGKQALYFYGFAPYHLAEGGPEAWEALGRQYAADYLDDLRDLTTNMSDENILGSFYMTPVDIERNNNAMIGGDIIHLAMATWQSGGNRPVAGYGQYRSPLEKLYMCGASTHPGGGVNGASGRSVARIVMEDLGLDFDEIVAR